MEKTKMPKRFEGKVAIVTASTMGIGLSIAERLGLEGASVVISSRKQENVDKAVKQLKSQGIEVLGLVCHVLNAQQRKNLIDQTIQKYGKIDVIVSNAATNPDYTSKILETKETILDKLWETNVKASILLLKDAAPHLKKGSSVVLVASMVAFQQPITWSMYSVTKTALLGLTKVLAADLGPSIRVNCIAPGIVPTRFGKIFSEGDVKKWFEGKSLLKRLGTPEEMASATAFLASDDASYITGETLVVAGGTPSRL